MSKSKRKYNAEAFKIDVFPVKAVTVDQKNGQRKQSTSRVKLPDFVTVEMIYQIIARIQEL